MKTPIAWFGGKTILGSQILPYFPTHIQYIEIFGGSASLLFQKIPSKLEVYNDINDRLVNFWKIMKEQPYDLILECQRIGQLDSRQLFEEYKQQSSDVLEDAARFIYVNRLSFSKKGDSYHGKYPNQNQSKIAFNNCLDSFLEVGNRLKEVIIECQDFRTIFKRFDDPNAFFYIDPPYVQGGKEYEKGIGGKEWKESDLKECLEICESLQAKCMISLDKKELCPKGFVCIPIQRTNFTDISKGKNSRNIIEEYLFINYNPKTIQKPIAILQKTLI